MCLLSLKRIADNGKHDYSMNRKKLNSPGRYIYARLTYLDDYVFRPRRFRPYEMNRLMVWKGDLNA